MRSTTIVSPSSTCARPASRSPAVAGSANPRAATRASTITGGAPGRGGIIASPSLPDNAQTSKGAGIQPAGHGKATVLLVLLQRSTGFWTQLAVSRPQTVPAGNESQLHRPHHSGELVRRRHFRGR